MNRGETPEPLIIDDTTSPTILQNRRRVTIGAAVGCTALVVLVIVAGAIGAGVYFARNNSADNDAEPTASYRPSTQPLTQPVPLNPSHADLAEAVRSNMDEYASPCDDFFQYSCGGWLINNPLGSADQNGRFLQVRLNNLKSLKNLIEGSVDSSVPAVQLARQFYHSCTNTYAINARGVQPLRDLVRLTGGWNTIYVSNSTAPAWSLNGPNLAEEHMYGSTAFFSLFVQVDDKNSSRYIAKLTQSGLTISPDHYSTLKESLKEYIAGQLDKLDKGIYHFHDGAAEDIVNVETKLAKIFVDTKSLSPNALYNVYTLQQLQTSWTRVDWVKYFKAQFSRVGITVTESLKVVVATPFYFQQLSYVLNQFSESQLRNYAKWHLILGYLPHLSDDVQESFHSFKSATESLDVLELTTSSVRDLQCVLYLQTIVPYTLSRLYTEHILPSGTKEQIEIMASDIKTAFIQRLQNNTWIDQPTRQASINKVNAIKQDVAYPQFIYQPQELYARSKPIVLSGGSYFETFKFHNYQSMINSYALLNQPVDKSKWLSAPTQVNAFYYPNFNKFEFEEGIMNPPFFKADWPDYFKFGAMGTVTGHELTHGFDNHGQLYNQNGTLTPWWTTASQQQFDQRKSCFVDQYSDYSIQDQYVDGQQTLGENIADNGGLKTAFKAYKNAAKLRNQPKLSSINLTPDQLFFVAFAQLWCSSYSISGAESAVEDDVHSPDPVRVLGTLSNNEDFAKAFNCPSGATYNPTHKCDLW